MFEKERKQLETKILEILNANRDPRTGRSQMGPNPLLWRMGYGDFLFPGSCPGSAQR